MSVVRLWWLSLGIAGAVVVVVAGLLGMIVQAARSIDEHANSIWIVGKQIAGNTVSIWVLTQINDQTARILDAAKSIDKTTTAMDEKLRALAATGDKG